MRSCRGQLQAPRSAAATRLPGVVKASTEGIGNHGEAGGGKAGDGRSGEPDASESGQEREGGVLGTSLWMQRQRGGRAGWLSATETVRGRSVSAGTQFRRSSRAVKPPAKVVLGAGTLCAPSRPSTPASIVLPSRRSAVICLGTRGNDARAHGFLWPRDEVANACRNQSRQP